MEKLTYTFGGGEINIKQSLMVIFIVAMLVFVVVSPTRGEENIDLNFQSVKLKDAFRALADVANMNIVTDNSVKGTTTVHLEDISFQEAVDLLAKSSGLDYQIVDNTILVAGANKLEEGFGKKVTRVFKMKNSNSAEVKKSINLLVDDKSIRVDKRTNSLIVTTYQSDLPQIESTIKQLDQEKQQVIIQARVEEISHGGLKKLGFDWNFQKLTVNGNSATINDSKDDNNNTNASSELSTISDNISLNYLNVINILESNDQATNLANPQITTVDGKSAIIDIGNQVPIVKPGGDGKTEVEFKNIGISLDITPKIAEKNKIYMNVKPETSIVSKYFETASGIRYPIVETRKVQTNVRVANGKTIAIGGLITQDEVENMSKVPILGDLPILGKIFSSKSTEVEKTELIIFLTPKIVNSTVDKGSNEKEIKEFSYKLERGDSIWSVGNLFGISFAKILENNNLQYVNDLKIGQEIKVPVSKDNYYKIKSGDKLINLAKRYGVAISTIKKINGLSSLESKVGQEIVLPSKVK